MDNVIKDKWYLKIMGTMIIRKANSDDILSIADIQVNGWKTVCKRIVDNHNNDMYLILNSIFISIIGYLIDILNYSWYFYYIDN